ncbi:DinB family protein [Flavihumibacter petaseus]|uniref:DinB family protein n=1 Tax=Flavihumibacter petaseus NBRC 106054 TaxID=1220578 RepID=A0A0E9MWU3_9BACT|nr:DinB family protein [Flavihumibacter petaseus]GAO41881.1 hypothetical protein FPE01S_01_08960 [Flavihumibacter petaseus NBRC 106054]
MENKEPVIYADQLLKHWQGHRSLTRKVIEAFPEKDLFSFSVGGMRPFGELAVEMLDMSHPGITGIATRTWGSYGDRAEKITGKEALLKAWDEATEHINQVWPTVPAGRMQERDVAFGQYEGPVYWTLFYFIDNEVHHRGQGYVYLRALGITPPPFWDRS